MAVGPFAVPFTPPGLSQQDVCSTASVTTNSSAKSIARQAVKTWRQQAEAR